MKNMVTQNNIENARELRGLEIAKKNRQVKRIDDFSYEVLSQNRNGSYLVFQIEGEWICEQCRKEKH